MKTEPKHEKSLPDLATGIADCIFLADEAGHHAVAAYLETALNALRQSPDRDSKVR